MSDYDKINPPHYQRGPVINSMGKAIRVLQCIEVVRHITDFRLASAIKYIWRVAFGGKSGEDPTEDIRKAVWYLNDWLAEPVKTSLGNKLDAPSAVDSPDVGYTQGKVFVGTPEQVEEYMQLYNKHKANPVTPFMGVPLTDAQQVEGNVT